jgi:hypothetical protein
MRGKRGAFTDAFSQWKIGQGLLIYFWVLAVAYEPNVKQQQIPAG